MNSDPIPTTLCHQYLDILYQNEAIPQAALQRVTSSFVETPGEILPISMSNLLHLVAPSAQDVFIDLGSGIGKTVVQAFLETDVKQAIGIEIVSDWHTKAVSISQHLTAELPAFFLPARQLTFLQGSFLEIPFPTSTIAFVNGVCFSPSLLHAIGEIINQTTNIHTVLALRPIPTLQRLRFQQSVTVQCSWDTALCYLYY